MPQRFHRSKELSISFHVITGHYHSMIIIAHSSIHELRKIFVNFTFRVRHICLNLKLNILLKTKRKLWNFLAFGIFDKIWTKFLSSWRAKYKTERKEKFQYCKQNLGEFLVWFSFCCSSPPSWLLVVGLIRERNNEIPTVAAAPFSSNSNKSPSFAINGEFVRIN